MANCWLYIFNLLPNFWAYICYVLAIYGQEGAPVFIFFIDARDRMAGGQVGGRMSRASMKKEGGASGLDFSTMYSRNTPGYFQFWPALAGSDRRWPVLQRF